ncbi:hypothetical protein [Actinoplanes sp. NPDC049316]|uniref:hypothetical protein n=1 Tax=Actinoplanes sp. NPDC049316 TaxID=3154727 RepID=UPI003445AF08
MSRSSLRRSSLSRSSLRRSVGFWSARPLLDRPSFARANLLGSLVIGLISMRPVSVLSAAGRWAVGPVGPVGSRVRLAGPSAAGSLRAPATA